MAPLTALIVGTDGSPAAGGAVAYAGALATQLDAELIVVHAVGLLEYLPGQDTEPTASVTAEVERLLTTDWTRGLRAAKVAHRCVTEHGPPLLALPRVAERESADLIVVARHGRNEAHGLLVGSTAHGLVQSSPVPVLVV